MRTAVETYKYEGTATIERFARTLPSVDFMVTVNVYAGGGIDIEVDAGRSTYSGSYAYPGPDWRRTALQFTQTALKRRDPWKVVTIRGSWV